MAACRVASRRSVTPGNFLLRHFLRDWFWAPAVRIYVRAPRSGAHQRARCEPCHCAELATEPVRGAVLPSVAGAPWPQWQLHYILPSQCLRWNLLHSLYGRNQAALAGPDQEDAGCRLKEHTYMFRTKHLYRLGHKER